MSFIGRGRPPPRSNCRLMHPVMPAFERAPPFAAFSASPSAGTPRNAPSQRRYFYKTFKNTRQIVFFSYIKRNKKNAPSTEEK